MKDRQYFIFVCCGAGKLTSYMAAEGIKNGLKSRGWDTRKRVKIQHGLINDVSRYTDKIDILVSSTNYTRTHDFPVVNGIAFVMQNEEDEIKCIDEVENYLKDIIARESK